ncbi:MAG: 50S ribosomal protein L20 [Bdellovibrionales bacterium]|nr:50S ribosomal protein L20 [Bdellovibrionales bacterium]
MRVKRGFASKRRHNRVMKRAKGFRGRRKNCYSMAVNAVDKALVYAYRDRRVKKRDFRSLWIVRINAAAREHGLSYSVFMNGLKRAEVGLDRKALASLACNDKQAFAELSAKAKAALG